MGTIEATPEDIERVWNYLVGGRMADAFEISAGIGMQGLKVALSLMELSASGMLLDRKTDTPHKYYLVETGATKESTFEVLEGDVTRILGFLQGTRFATASDISRALEMQQIHALLAIRSMELKGTIARTSDDVIRYFIPPYDPDVDGKIIGRLPGRRK